MSLSTRARLVPAVIVGVGAALATVAFAGAQPDVAVGRQVDGSVVVPTAQRITPTGRQVEFAGRPNEIAVRPGGGVAAALVASGQPVQTFDLASGRAIAPQPAFTLIGSASYAGLAWAPDGTQLFASLAGGAVAFVSVAADGALGATQLLTLPMSTTGPNALQNPYPGGIAVSPDGRTLYVALSRDNALGVIDVATRELTARIPVGNAPHTVVVDGSTAYVSNEGGRPATPTDVTNDSAGTRIVSDPDHFSGGATTGTVSVVDLAAEKESSTVAVDLHPTALLLDGGTLYVANTNSDTVSMVDTDTHTVTGTIEIAPYPGAPYGAAPTGLAMLPGDRLAVTLGLANAVAVYDVDPAAGTSTYEGLLPTAWYPSDAEYDATSASLVVANLHGVGTVADSDAGRPARGLGEVGSVSIMPAPSTDAVRGLTAQVAANNGWDHVDTTPANPDARPKPVPDHIGEPSPITHIVYVIKENRTYDQLLGDVGRGNSDPSLAEFGAPVTPNTHALATRFPLMDNFYDSGRRSNDGHQWSVQAAAPDYLEKGVATERTNIFGLGRGTPPSSGFDALLYLKSGFLWENALRHGKTFDDFGEYTVEDWGPPAVSDIPSLESHVVPEFPGFELTTPDVERARIFANHLATYEARGEMPNLIQLTLPDDHTGGSNPLYPTPTSEVADNDQGLGEIVDAISHSPFWSSTAIFVTEDDTQGGPDHVEGHRGPLLVISPYARQGGIVDSTFYTQVSVVRTIEQILGLPPMNQLDAATEPVRTAFTDKDVADLTADDLAPYDAVVPPVLENGPVPNPPVSALHGVQRAWARAARHYDLRHLDAVNTELLNRDVWYSTHDWRTPYPGDPKVFTPRQVLRRYPYDGDDGG